MNEWHDQTDGQLLSEFSERGDQEAFAALVKRHGPMVNGTGLRVLGDRAEAQDVAQAVFMTLAAKAGQLRKDSTAQQLGLSVNAVSKRLARARETLRNKLVRRGVTVGSAGALTELLSAEAGAAVLPSTFVSATVQAASLAAAGNLAAGVGTGVVSANVAALTKGACNMLFWSSVKTAAVATAAAAVVAGSSAIVAQEVAAQRKAARPPVAAEAQAPGKDASASTNAAAIGDDAMAMCLRAQQQARAKDYGAAIQTFETLLRTYPDAKAVRPEAMYWLGDSYSKSGNHAAAKRVWERLNSEFPDSNWGKYARGRLSTDSEQPASPVKDAAKPFPAP